MAEERWAIHVDGIKLPGYDSYEEAQAKIDADPDLKSRGAVVVQLIGALTYAPRQSELSLAEYTRFRKGATGPESK